MRRTYFVAISYIAILVSPAPFAQAQQQHTITTVAGGVPNNMSALQVGLGGPLLVSRDSAGNLYVAAGGLSNAIYRIDASGQLTTVAGNGTNHDFSGEGGPATSASIRVPGGLFVDGSANIFIADTFDARILEVVAATGTIHTVAGNGQFGFGGDGGPATSATLSDPRGVYVDNAGNIFIADEGNGRIREVLASTGNIETIAGNGTCCSSGGDGGLATNATLGAVFGIFGDGSGNVFFTETDGASHNRVREVVADTGIIQTVAGNGSDGFSGDGGPATSAALGFPGGVFVDRSGNLFIADTGNERIREVVATTGIIQTVAGGGTGSNIGDGGPATSARLIDPTGVSVDGAGNIFIADGNLIREVVAATGNIQTVAGNGTCCFTADGGLATSAELVFVFGGGASVDRSGNIFIADPQDDRIRQVEAATGIIQTVAGNGMRGFSGDGGPAINAALDFPINVFINNFGNLLITDQGNNRIREVAAASGTIQTVASGLSTPYGVSLDSSGNIFIADTYKNSILKLDTAQTIQTVAGNGTAGYSGDGGPATSATLSFPTGVFVDSSGNLFIADQENNRVREVVAATGIIQTVAGNEAFGFSGDGGPATSAALNFPSSVYLDSAGNLFIADFANQRIRKVDAVTGIIQTVVGNGAFGFSGDGGPATSAELAFPSFVCGDRQGNLLIVDSSNDRIRRVTGVVAVVGITVGPGTATVSPGATQQFTASVSDALNTSVTWSLSGTGCSDSACGTISPQGLYTAPSTASSPLTVMVTATSVADDTKSATATVTVPTKQGTSVAVTSSANPSLLGQKVTLTATLSPASGSGTPTGTVTFSDGANMFGTATVIGGQAMASFASYVIGGHTITATYSGDSGFFGSNGSLTQNVSYGICPLYDQTKAVRSGATIPIQLYLCDAGGNDLSSMGVALHATQVTGTSGSSSPPATSGNANPNGNFRYDATLGPTGGYVFSLSTTGLSSGTYSLKFTTAGDPVPHVVSFAVK